MDTNDVKNASETAKTTFQSIKSILSALKNRKFITAGKECWACGKNVYGKRLKGKYVEVRGKKIPLTAIVVVILLGLYVMSSGEKPKEMPLTETASREQTNVFNQDGIKVYDMRKCDQAACGLLENETNEPIAKIIITVTFHNPQGNPIYESSVEANDFQEMARIKFNIPCEEDFAYFKLKDVIVQK